MNELFAQAQKEREQGNLSQAEQLFIKIVAEGQTLEDIALQEQCLEQLVEISRIQQETHNTLRWLKKQYALAKKYNAKRAAELCVDIAHVSYQRKDFDEGKSGAQSL